MPNYWTDTDTQALAKMWAEGKTGQQIAIELGYTRSAVLGKASREGLSPRGCPPLFKVKKQREERREFGLSKIAVIEKPCENGSLFEDIAGDFNLCHAPIGMHNGKQMWCGRCPTVSALNPYCSKCYQVVYRPTPGKKLFDEAV